MTTERPDLVLFTAGFPYDGYESVLASELDVIAGRFDRIFIVPSRAGAKRGQLPINAVVVDLGWDAGWTRREKHRALRSRSARRVVRATLRSTSNWWPYGSSARSYLDILATSLLKAESLEAWIRENRLGRALFYDYWFENSTLAIALLRRRGVIRCAVSRAHGFDVFDSRWDLGRVPFREFKGRSLDALFAVSQDGADYLREKLGRDGDKVRLARLGLRINDARHFAPQDPPLVVSCAALRPLKRVDLIPEVLRRCGRPLRWVHFGDGPERQRVEAAAAALPPEVGWELRGQVDNATVHEYYRFQPVASFVSLSLAEGIPVSMMEAQGFGIPIVALSVGGVPEVVAGESGLLLPPDAAPDQVAAAINEAVAPSRFDRELIRRSFLARFDAHTNYERFADSLLATWERAAGTRGAPEGANGT